MGVVLKQKGYSNILKKIYSKMIDIIMNDNNINESIVYLKIELNKLVNGNVNLEDLIITKPINNNTKNKTAHYILATKINSRKNGNVYNNGDRIEFIYIIHNNIKMIESIEFINDNKNVTIDFEYYINNQLTNPISQLLALGINKIDTGYNSNYWDNKDIVSKQVYIKDMIFSKFKIKNKTKNN
jgi:DNA polymerase elongation subunit (family B)